MTNVRYEEISGRRTADTKASREVKPVLQLADSDDLLAARILEIVGDDFNPTRFPARVPEQPTLRSTIDLYTNLINLESQSIRRQFRP